MASDLTEDQEKERDALGGRVDDLTLFLVAERDKNAVLKAELNTEHAISLELQRQIDWLETENIRLREYGRGLGDAVGDMTRELEAAKAEAKAEAKRLREALIELRTVVGQTRLLAPTKHLTKRLCDAEDQARAALEGGGNGE